MPGYFVDCNITICSFFWLIKPDFSPFKEKLVRLIKKKLVKKELIKNELNMITKENMRTKIITCIAKMLVGIAKPIIFIVFMIL